MAVKAVPAINRDAMQVETSDTDRGKATPAALEMDEESAI